MSLPGVALILLAAALAVAPIPAAAVETCYSNGLYPPLQSALTAFSNRFPFALLDAAIAACTLWWLWRLARDVFGRDRRTAGALGFARAWLAVLFRVLTRTIITAAAVYIVFLLVWGFNYRRTRLTERLQFDAGAVSAAGARGLARASVEQLNTGYSQARGRDAATDGTDPALAEAFIRARTMVGLRADVVTARPKTTVLDLYLRSAGVDGMTDPLFLETLTVSDLLPFERPFVLAHEWSHLAGVTDEGEANFVGWLSCLQGDARTSYSGWLFLYSEIAGGLPPLERAELSAQLGPGPREDLRAIAARLRRNLRPFVANAGWKVYDRYLKYNRIESGTASYAEVVRLILGTKFDEGWKPRLK